MSSEYFITVAVNAPIMEPLTYKSTHPVEIGTSVIVPLGARKVSGIALQQSSKHEPTKFKLKNIASLPEDRPALPEKILPWLKWISQYYIHPLGQVIETCFPPLKKQLKPRKSKKRSVLPEVEYSPPPKLSTEQSHVLGAIQKQIDHFAVHLLHGVTGSGKTEIYLHLIDEVLKSGKQALVLVPEIALTPQHVERFSARFPNKIAVLHSGLTDRERTNQWWNAYSGEKPILIGARSASFCPIQNYGIIIVDEEHDSSFKQDEKLKYHGRDCAIMLAKHHNCPVILGSATPSLETWHNASTGKYQLHSMPSRVQGRQLPKIEVIDMKDERTERKNQTHSDQSLQPQLPFWMSDALYKKMKATYEKGEQSALFLNRRGMAQTVLCQDCGYVYECPNCAISLTLHQSHHLICHYCDYAITLKDQCISCKEPSVTSLGIGTELVEQDVLKLFPGIRLARADRDQISSREDMEDLIKSVEHGDVDILIGTQMIAKGLDFPKLTLIGLIMADVGFNLPDFRAAERSFQLLTQVAGRAGRHSIEPGQVVIQTYNPSYKSIEFALTNDFKGFATQELQERADFNYPPIGKIACIRIQGMHLKNVQQCGQLLKARCEALKEKTDQYQTIQILGPSPAPIERLRNKYRYHLLLKSPSLLTKFCHQLLSDQKWVPKGVKIIIDIDPLNML